MESPDSAPAASHASADANASTSQTPAAPAPAALPARARIWAIALAFGLAAGVVAWVVGELTLNVFRPKVFTMVIMMQTYVIPTTPSINESDTKNAILAFAIYGAITGLVMGLAGGVARGSMNRGITVAVGGLALGAVVGGLSALLFLKLYYRAHVPDPNDILTPLTVHGGIWTAIGAVGGLAFGVGIGAGRRIPQAVEGACIGAFFAAVLFHLLSGFFFPDSGFAQPISRESLNRLLARLLVSVLLAAGAARGAQERIVRSKKSTPLALGD